MKAVDYDGGDEHKNTNPGALCYQTDWSKGCGLFLSFSNEEKEEWKFKIRSGGLK